MFDMDGVLIESEGLWDEVREKLAKAHGGRWHPQAHRVMMGMSSAEWTAYMRDEIGVALAPAQIKRAVVQRLMDEYRRELPLIRGAREAVGRLAPLFALAVCSSSPRELIDLVIERAGLRDCFSVTLSTEEAARGKPAPDAYLRAAELLGIAPQRCAAVEDSTNGLRAALAAGMRVIAIPNRDFPPDPSVVAQAGAVLASIEALAPHVVTG